MISRCLYDALDKKSVSISLYNSNKQKREKMNIQYGIPMEYGRDWIGTRYYLPIVYKNKLVRFEGGYNNYSIKVYVNDACIASIKTIYIDNDSGHSTEMSAQRDLAEFEYYCEEWIKDSLNDTFEKMVL